MIEIEKNNQFGQEHKAWQRSLEFFKQENTLLKYRLSEMVDQNGETIFLQLAEYYQNQLILKDEILNNLIRELIQFSEKFHAPNNDGKQSEIIINQHANFRRKILLFEKDFLTFSKEFNERMLQSI
ncbi:MAG: hypothetical protein Q8891_08810 [Bacteroidota bacterium]|nr:hypothetical protein [Bacteroidota bacterium]